MAANKILIVCFTRLYYLLGNLNVGVVNFKISVAPNYFVIFGSKSLSMIVTKRFFVEYEYGIWLKCLITDHDVQIIAVPRNANRLGDNLIFVSLVNSKTGVQEILKHFMVFTPSITSH